MPPGRAAAPSPASSAPRLGARPAAPSPPASDASRPTSPHPALPFPARALPQGPGMLRFTPDSAIGNLDARDDVRPRPAHQVRLDPLPRAPLASVLRVKPALETGSREAAG